MALAAPLITVYSWVRAPPGSFKTYASVAQLVEQWPFKPLVTGSSPVGGIMESSSVVELSAVNRPVVSSNLTSPVKMFKKKIDNQEI